MNPNQPIAALEAEKAVLGSILLHGERYDDVSGILSDRDFYRDSHRRIFRQIAKMAESGQAIDALTVKEGLIASGDMAHVNGPSEVYALVDGMASGANVEAYAGIVKGKSLKRTLAAMGTALTEAAFGEAEASEVLEEAQQKLWAISMQQETGELVSADLLVQDAWKRLEDLAARRGMRGVSTGLSDLDGELGGLKETDLIILAARPAMGKTALAVNVASSAARSGVRTAVFSLEMSKDQLMFRILSAEAQINLRRLLEGRSSEVEQQRLGVALNEIAGWPLHVDDTAMTTVPDIRSKCRRMQAKHGLGLIVVDYLQLMNDPSRKAGESRVLELAAISRGLKQIAKELRVPVLALSQLSREVEKRNPKRPQLSDLRDSGALEQDADVVLLLWREEEYQATPQNAGLAEIIIAKHRQGSTGSVVTRFCKELTQFRDMGGR